MKRVIGPRASTILYNTLKANHERIEGAYMVLPANVCPIVPVTFMKAGVKFNFLDIDTSTQCIDTFLLKKELRNPMCKGVLFVHSYGDTQDTLGLFKEIRATRNDVFLIDDRCSDLPRTDASMQNALADLNLYSTGYAKFVEFGYGGFGFLADGAKYAALSGPYEEKDHETLVAQMNQSIQNSAQFEYIDSDWLEWNHTLDPNSYFEKIEAQIPISTAQKNKLNKIYAERLPKEIQMPLPLCRWRFNLQVDDKSKLIKAIFKGGLYASSHYSSVSTIFGRARAPKAEASHARMLNLFNDYRFTESDAVKVCEIINNTLR